MKLEKCTVIKHGNAYSEKIRYGFCPECSELEVEFISKDTAIRGSGMIKYTVASYKYECKNCGCVWSEDDIVKRRVKLSDETVKFLATLLGIILVCGVVCINVIVIGVAVRFIESFF